MPKIEVQLPFLHMLDRQWPDETMDSISTIPANRLEDLDAAYNAVVVSGVETWLPYVVPNVPTTVTADPDVYEPMVRLAGAKTVESMSGVVLDASDIKNIAHELFVMSSGVDAVLETVELLGGGSPQPLMPACGPCPTCGLPMKLVTSMTSPDWYKCPDHPGLRHDASCCQKAYRVAAAGPGSSYCLCRNHDCDDYRKQRDVE